MEMKENIIPAPSHVANGLKLIICISLTSISTSTRARRDASNERHMSITKTSLVLRYLLMYFPRLLLRLLIICFCLNYFQFFRRHVGGGDGEHAGEFHEDAAGFAYSYNLSFYSFEWAFFDLYVLAFAKFVAYFCEED